MSKKHSFTVFIVLLLFCIVVTGIVILHYCQRYKTAQSLITMIEQEDIDGIQALLDKGIDPNVPTAPSILKRLLFLAESPREFPLTEACKGGNAEIVRILVEHGATATQCDKLSDPLFYTLERFDANDYEIVVLLLQAGNDPYKQPFRMVDNRFNGFSKAALLSPYIGKEYDPNKAEEITRIVTYMLEYSEEDVNTAHGDGYYSLLMAAAFAGNTALIEYLLAIGADKTITINGKTAYDCAMERGYIEIAEMVKP